MAFALRLLVVGLLASLLVLMLVWRGRAAAEAVTLPDPVVDDALDSARGRSTVVLAGGCFWGIEEVFQHVKGVTDAVSGYSGGTARTASYDAVSTGTSGHAESVKVTYDPATITLGQILKVFFSVAHDPTQRNRQGADIGTQYRSAIFYASERQQRVAKAYVDQLTAAHAFRKPIVTELVPLSGFYDAEAEHQDFAARNPYHQYIVLVDKPKVAELRKEFPTFYR
jgi:peptide-methionine (S)-S-oxide reductase